MKTSELVTLLATSAEPVDRRAGVRRVGTAIVLGLLGAAVLMQMLLGLNPGLRAAMTLPMFWVKLTFIAAVLTAGAVTALRLAKPGARLARLPALIGAPLVAVWALAVVVLAHADAADRAQLVLGQTWRTCPFNITVLSVPAFFATFWAMKGLAPTRLRLAGAGAGLLAAATGTLIYTLHCPELAAPFLGIWYVLGMLIPTLIGAAIGPRVLRW